jgi:hypothetical protein
MPASRTPTPNRRRSCTGAASTNCRLVRPTGPHGPCCGVRKESHGLRGCAYADGSRASWHDGGYSAEKSACSRWLLQDTQGCAYPNTRKTGRRFIQMPAASSTRTLMVFQRPSRRAGVQKTGTKDYITVGEPSRVSQTGAAPGIQRPYNGMAFKVHQQLWVISSTTVDNRPAEYQSVSILPTYPQAASQLSSGQTIPYPYQVAVIH